MVGCLEHDYCPVARGNHRLGLCLSANILFLEAIYRHNWTWDLLQYPGILSGQWGY